MTNLRTFLFAAGDVGGARAILPVARLAHAQGHRIVALQHGILHTEGDADWTWVSHDQACTTDCDAVIYATSVVDPLAFQCALAARDRDCRILHVLDNWSLYGARLHGPDTNGNRQTLIPDFYAVMDQMAYDGALEDGVPANTLHITGHPDLAKLEAERTSFAAQPTSIPNILFVSEPASKDSGTAQDPDGRGYDEITVSTEFAQALADTPLAQGITIHVAPHPREDRDVVSQRWDALIKTYLPQNRYLLVPENGVRQALHTASHVAGMTSILLYEAWLLEHPTLSLQPNLKWPQMEVIGQRHGVFLCTKASDIQNTVRHWTHQHGPVGTGRQQRLAHSDAAARLLEYLKHI